jgi:uncharacterized protein (DUF2267 family)
MTQPDDVKHATERYQEWLAALKDRASLATHNQSQALMRAVMHALRASVSPEAALRIANALPALPRGIFLDGWTLDAPWAPPASAEAFHRDVHDRIREHHTPPPTITADVFAVWARALGPIAAATIHSALPEVLKPLWPTDPDGR